MTCHPPGKSERHTQRHEGELALDGPAVLDVDVPRPVVRGARQQPELGVGSGRVPVGDHVESGPPEHVAEGDVGEHVGVRRGETRPCQRAGPAERRHDDEQVAPPRSEEVVGGVRGRQRVGQVLPDVTAVSEIERRSRVERGLVEEAAAHVELEPIPRHGGKLGIGLDAENPPPTIAQHDQCATDATTDVERSP